MVAVRSITGLRNRVRSISDSLDVQRFNGKVYDLTIKERRWVVLGFPKAAICITQLEGLPSASQMYIEKQGENLSLVQDMYRGELTNLFDDRISTAWLFHFVDKPLTQDDATQYLQDITVEECRSMDSEIPRSESWYVHSIRVIQEDKEILQGVIDPYE